MTAYQSIPSILHQIFGLDYGGHHNQTEAYLAHFTHLNAELSHNQKAFSQNSSKLRSLFMISSAIIFALIFFIAIHFFHTSIFALLALLIIFARLLPQFSNGQQAYLQVVTILPIYQELCDLRHTFQSHQEKMDITPTQTLILKEGIHLKQIDYHYPNQSAWLIHDLTCTIPARQITAIVGLSGAGKSTLADLLLGLLSPTQGSIFLDQQAFDESLYFSWRNAVSYIPQDPYFFNESIKANLLWAAPDATEAEMWESLKQAGVDQVIANLPDGLKTLLGEHASRLAGGERQRLALARALLRKPSVLLLDEATSALDRYHEAHIHQSLKSLTQTTIIIITHHPQTVRLAHQVLVLEKGQLLEQGGALFAPC